MGKSLNGKELGKGISQRPDGRYMARFTTSTGARKTLYANKYNEVVKKLRDAQYEDEKRILPVSNNGTVNELFELWLKEKEGTVKPLTFRRYSIVYNYIKPQVGGVKLNKLTPQFLQSVISSLTAHTTKTNCWSLLNMVLDRGVDFNLIPTNPMSKVKYPKKHRVNRATLKEEYLTEEQVHIILTYARGKRCEPILTVAADTGMRIGEILGLSWEYVDFKENVIKVRQNLIYTFEAGGMKGMYISTPKTQSSVRDIPMTKKVRDCLLEVKMMSANLPTYDTEFDELVFRNRNGRPIPPSAINKYLKDLQKRIKVDFPDFPHFHPHTFRHTFASRCLERGMSPKALQAVLGHSDISITLNIYCHIHEERVKEEMGLIGEMPDKSTPSTLEGMFKTE